MDLEKSTVTFKTKEEGTVTIDYELIKNSEEVKSMLEKYDYENCKDTPIPLPDITERALSRLVIWLKHHRLDFILNPKMDGVTKAIHSDWDKYFLELDPEITESLVEAAKCLGFSGFEMIVKENEINAQYGPKCLEKSEEPITDELYVQWVEECVKYAIKCRAVYKTPNNEEIQKLLQKLKNTPQPWPYNRKILKSISKKMKGYNSTTEPFKVTLKGCTASCCMRPLEKVENQLNEDVATFPTEANINETNKMEVDYEEPQADNPLHFENINPPKAHKVKKSKNNNAKEFFGLKLVPLEHTIDCKPSFPFTPLDPEKKNE